MTAAVSCNNFGRFVAHRRELDGEIQDVHLHLAQVADLTSQFADKIGLAAAGTLIGLLHDLGKYAGAFQKYFELSYSGGKKIDHATAGAQFLWRELYPEGTLPAAVAQAMALCISSHHGGLIDCLSPMGDDRFEARMQKDDANVHLQEVLGKADAIILTRARRLIADASLLDEFRDRLKAIIDGEKVAEGSGAECRFQFLGGLLIRTLFSCLIDADRTNTADFEDPTRVVHRNTYHRVDWHPLIGRLESHLQTFDDTSPVNATRARISNECRHAAERDKGVFTLTVPTGGGKTLASLRFAMHHARRRKHDRIVFVVPYTTIIDQNAQDARDILEHGPNTGGVASVVLEHHSNLTPDEDTPRSKLISENWDAPVVYTTMVQLLESLFGGGTRGVRRLHQLANAVIVFDEVQALPVTTVHLFCNAVNFLVGHCGSSVVLCTATQPLLDRVDARKGAVRLKKEDEIIPDVSAHFQSLKRAHVADRRVAGGWTNEAIVALAGESLRDAGSCLLIVNTKGAALSLYRLAKARNPESLICHLSTGMCPAHRSDVLERIYSRIGKRGKPPTEPGPVFCVSTQLIEAGVDVDFGSVIRFVAGLDSIAQAAGRCNRHGKRSRGILTVVNPADENLGKLENIRLGRDAAIRVLDEYAADPASLDNDLLSPAAIDRFFQYYFFATRDRMDYPVDVGHDDTLLNLLGKNTCACEGHKRNTGQLPKHYWRQSFKSAAEAFKAMDAPTHGVIVPYGQVGCDLIGELCATTDPTELRDILRKAQRYSVNVYRYTLDQLQQAGGVYEAQAGTGILCVDPIFYNSEEFGLDVDGQSEQPFLNG